MCSEQGVSKARQANRRQFLKTAMAGVAAAGAAHSAAGTSVEAPSQAGDQPVVVGSGRWLFTDDRLVDTGRTHDVVRTLNTPQVVRRVLTPERPWESLGFIFYSTVIEDEKEVKLYYGSYGWDGRILRNFCLATSQDGIDFERACLNKKTFDGKSMDTNLLFPAAIETGLFLDPHAPAEKRYRMIYSGGGIDNPAKGGVYTATSADGIRWRENPARLLPFIPDSQHTAYWDEQLEKYVIYLRAWGRHPRVRNVCRVVVDDIDKPWPYDASVAPMCLWGKDKTPTLGQEYPTVMTPDDKDPENLDIYTNVVTPYPYAAGTFLAFPAAYFKFIGPLWRPRALTGNDGNFEVQLATSPDGITWNRWRQPYVAAGYYGDLDLRLVSMAKGMVRRGRWLYQYFVGWPHTHGRPGVWNEDPADGDAWTKKEKGGIYLARQRVDGFVSMDGGYTGGVFTTKPLTFTGNRLHLNLDTRGAGCARVALLDREGKPLAGFTIEQCDVINADDTDHVVRWKNQPDVGKLEGQVVCVQVEMRNTKLYAIQFGTA